MIKSFEVGAIFGIKDEATATLRRLADQVKAFDTIVIRAREHLAALGVVKFPGLSGELKGLNDQAAQLKNTFGLTTKTMTDGAGTATAEVNALASAWARVGAEAKAAAAAMRIPGIGGAAAVAGMPNANLRARAAHGRGFGPTHGYVSAPLMSGMHARAGIGMGPAIAGGALAYGMFEEAELEDATFQMKWHAGLPNTPDNTRYFRELIQSTAAQTGFGYKEIAEAATDEIRLLKGAGGKESGGLGILSEMLRAAAVEARVKPGTTLTTAMQSLVQQAHMAQEYGIEDIKGMAPLLAFLSTTNPATMPQMTRAASYAMPTLHSALGINPADVLFETTALARAGATSTKAGTWVRSAFEHSLPGQFDRKQRIEAMRQLGLIDEAGHSTVLDPTGHLDIDKLLSTVHGRTEGMGIEDRSSYLKKVFLEQGERGMTLLMSPAVMQQTAELKKEFPEFKNRYSTFFEDYSKGSPIQKTRESWQDLTNVLVDIGSVALPPVVKGLSALDLGLKALHLPGTVSTNAVEGAMLGGTMGAVAGSGFGGVGAIPGAVVGAGVGAIFGAIKGFGEHLLGLDSATEKAAHDLDLLSGAASRAAKPERHSMNFIPPPRTERAIILSSTLNIDGRTLAEQLSEQTAALYEHPTSAAAANGLAYVTPPDSGWGVG